MIKFILHVVSQLANKVSFFPQFISRCSNSETMIVIVLDLILRETLLRIVRVFDLM